MIKVPLKSRYQRRLEAFNRLKRKVLEEYTLNVDLEHREAVASFVSANEESLPAGGVLGGNNRC